MLIASSITERLALLMAQAAHLPRSQWEAKPGTVRALFDYFNDINLQTRSLCLIFVSLAILRLVKSMASWTTDLLSGECESDKKPFSHERSNRIS